MCFYFPLPSPPLTNATACTVIVKDRSIVPLRIHHVALQPRWPIDPLRTTAVKTASPYGGGVSPICAVTLLPLTASIINSSTFQHKFYLSPSLYLNGMLKWHTLNTCWGSAPEELCYISNTIPRDLDEHKLTFCVFLLDTILQEIASLSLNSYVHIWDAETFKQVTTSFHLFCEVTNIFCH